MSGRTRFSRAASVLALVVVAALGTACSDDADDPGGQGASSTSTGTPTPTPSPTPPSRAERLGLAEGWGPSAEQLDEAARLVKRMPLPNLAGQVIVASWQGTSAPTSLVRDLHLGGVIAFADNIASPDQIRAVNRTLSTRVRRDWPLFISVDQEGGIVERIGAGVTRFPTFMSAGAAGDAVLTRKAARASGEELRGLGFTVDFAPDADVTSGPSDPTIGSRSASSDSDIVAEQSAAAAQGFIGAGIVPVLKHFPGHGSVPSDSHSSLPVQKRSLKQLRAVELVPFRSAVEAGLPAIMVGHLDIRAVAPGVPASVSRPVVTGLLRDELGFQGLVVTDALDMAGVTRTRSSGQSAVQAIRAGVDVLLMPPSPAQARAALVRGVRTGSLSRSRLEQAAARQIALLISMKGGRGAAPGSGRPASRALSAGAITVVRGACEGALVSGPIYPRGDASAVANFRAAATAAGMSLLTRGSPPADLAAAQPRPTRRKGEKKGAFAARLKAWQREESRRQSALAAWNAQEDKRLARGTSIGFSGYQTGLVDGDVAIATDTPYVLGRAAAAVRIATYGSTPGAMSALVDVLLGRASAPGRLPVKVAGLAKEGC